MTTAPIASRPSETLFAQLIANSGSEAATRVGQILALTLAGWTLGVAGLAVIGPSWSLAAIALGVVQGGPDWVGLRSLSLAGASAEANAQTIADVTRLKLLLLLASAPVLFGIQSALGFNDTQAMMQLAAQIGAAAAASLGYIWVFRGLSRSFELAINRTVQAVANLALLVALLLIWKSPLAIPLAEAVASLLGLAMARRRLGDLCRAPASLHRIRPMVKPALALGFSGTLTTLGWLVPILAAARWSPVEQVSYLTGVLRLILGLQSFAHIVLLTAFPPLARLFASDPDRARVALLALMVQLGVAAAAGALVLVAAAPILIPLVLGPEFAAAVPLFRGMVPVLVPFALASPLIFALTAHGQTRLVAQSSSGTAAAMSLGCVAAFWLTTSAWGALVLHPVLWGQVAVTAFVAARCGVFGWRTATWPLLCNPFRIGRLLREEGGGIDTGPARPVDA